MSVTRGQEIENQTKDKIEESEIEERRGEDKRKLWTDSYDTGV